MKMKNIIEAFEEGVAQGLHTGMQMHVIHNGTIMIDDAFGETRNGEKLSAEFVMPWFSASKPFTAVAIAHLKHKGKIDWEHLVSRYIPEFNTGGKGDITLHHLLTHTGGFRGLGKSLNQTNWNEMVFEICNMPLESKWVPGETAGYHPATSWIILAEIFNRIMGISLNDWLHSQFLPSLGITDTFFSLTGEKWKSMSYQYEPVQKVLLSRGIPHQISNPEEGVEFLPGSSGMGPARDLGKFYQSLLTGGLNQWVSSSILEQLLSLQRKGKTDQTFGVPLDWSLGFIYQSNRKNIASRPYGFGEHAKNGSYGHGGAQSSIAFADPDNQLVIAWIVNGAPGEPKHQRRNHRLNTAIYRDLGLA